MALIVPILFQIQQYKRPAKLQYDAADQQVVDPSVFLTTPPTTPPNTTSATTFNIAPIMIANNPSPDTRPGEEVAYHVPNYLQEETVSSDEMSPITTSQQSNTSPPSYLAQHHSAPS